MEFAEKAAYEPDYTMCLVQVSRWAALPAVPCHPALVCRGLSKLAVLSLLV